MTPTIEAHSITVRVGGATLLDGVDLAVGAGETVAIVGPNGAGKSTLLRVLSGEIWRRDGAVRLKRRNIAEYAPHKLAKHRAMLSQSINITFPFTVREVVRMGAGQRHDRRIEALIDAALAEVDLSRFDERIITTLSGGEQHRAHFARVLVQLACGESEQGPGLLLLDEPTASLDLLHQINFAAATRKRARNGTAVVAVLHDLNLATTFAERLVVLDSGTIAADGTAAATITGEMVESVFGVSLTVGNTPDQGLPFVLPQMMTPSRRSQARR
jgi:iron complex transport system ATP-binding protein